jgi:membrane-associated phospholipid phosphatase
MESILNWGIGFIEALQSISSAPLTGVMSVLTLLGDKYFYFALMPFLFWCVNERKAVRLGSVVFVSGFLNSWLKDLFAVPRPYVLKPGINQGWKPIEKAFPDSLSIKDLPAGSLPSGHAQNSLALWGMLASWFKKPWGLVLAIALPLLVGFTRIYLGVHYPTDVVSAYAFSGVLLILYYVFGEKVEAFLGKANIRVQVAILAVICWVFCAIHLADVSAAGGLFGLGLGYAFMRKKVRLIASSGAWWKKLLRYVLGMAVVVGLYAGLKAVLPHEGDASYALFSFARYAVLTIWVSLGAPALFVRLKLADARPAESKPAPTQEPESTDRAQ